jgi:hypothetical protein
VAWIAIVGCDPGGDATTGGEGSGDSESGSESDSESGSESGSESAGESEGTTSEPGPGSATSVDDTGTEDGGETDGPPKGVPPCLEDATVLDSTEAMSDIGFTAADVLAFAAGEHASTFVLYDPGPYTFMNAGPPSPLALSVAHEGGEIRFVDVWPNPDSLDPDPYCPPRLEVDVVVGVVTDDGLFDESFETVLVAPAIDYAWFERYFDPHGFAGSFSGDDVSFEDGEITTFSIFGTFDPADLDVPVSGTLQAIGTSGDNEDPNETWGFNHTIGYWPT